VTANSILYAFVFVFISSREREREREKERERERERLSNQTLQLNGQLINPSSFSKGTGLIL
jgi:hypothetical protein